MIFSCSQVLYKFVITRKRQFFPFLERFLKTNSLYCFLLLSVFTFVSFSKPSVILETKSQLLSSGILHLAPDEKLPVQFLCTCALGCPYGQETFSFWPTAVKGQWNSPFMLVFPVASAKQKSVETVESNGAFSWFHIISKIMWCLWKKSEILPTSYLIRSAMKSKTTSFKRKLKFYLLS